MQEGDRDAELTAKSYVLQDYEGASRRAKVEWARSTQAQVINLQHDGVRMRFPFDVHLETALLRISDACSAALGYKQVVCVKQSPKGNSLLDITAEPSNRVGANVQPRAEFTSLKQLNTSLLDEVLPGLRFGRRPMYTSRRRIHTGNLPVPQSGGRTQALAQYWLWPPG